MQNRVYFSQCIYYLNDYHDIFIYFFFLFHFIFSYALLVFATSGPKLTGFTIILLFLFFFKYVTLFYQNTCEVLTEKKALRDIAKIKNLS